jgi:hypothetical protein
MNTRRAIRPLIAFDQNRFRISEIIEQKRQPVLSILDSTASRQTSWIVNAMTAYPVS